VLSDLTTLQVGGPCRRLLVATTDAEVVEAVSGCDATSEPVLVVGGGSNLVVADAGFPGTVVLLATTGVDVRPDGPDHVLVEVAAGEPWDGLVARSVAEGWSGLEALSGIPGLAGATPVQNVGAYGQEVAQTVVSVRVLDRATGAAADLTAEDCSFGYRTSRFKHDDRAVVLRVTYRLARTTGSAPLGYSELARLLGSEVGESAPTAEVRTVVLALRASKGMVLDPDDRDTASVGSFFTNPLLTPEVGDQLPTGAPRYPQPDGRVKTSAAWLIEQAGFARGYGHGDARISSKHTLALTNRGSATATDVVALAREIRTGVRQAFGVDLETEPRLVGLEL
jgi:UDP-N-acetylmuramate dehydrogenase